MLSYLANIHESFNNEKYCDEPMDIHYDSDNSSHEGHEDNEENNFPISDDVR